MWRSRNKLFWCIVALTITMLCLSACSTSDSDTDDDNQEPEPLTVGITATPAMLTEGEPTNFTLTITLSAAPPAAGVEVTIDSAVANSLAEFDVLAAVYNGAELVLANADSSGFTLNVFEQIATVTLTAFDDGVAEGPETLTYTLQPGADYDIDAAASAITVTILDTTPAPPDTLTVGITSTPAELIETDMTVFTLTLTLSEPPPAGGVDVTIDSTVPGSLAEFDVLAATYNGAVLVVANADSSGFTLNVFEQTATVTLAVFNDGVAEGLETLVYTLQPGANYDIDAAASAITVTIFDVAP
jgi:hypothetical protein